MPKNIIQSILVCIFINGFTLQTLNAQETQFSNPQLQQFLMQLSTRLNSVWEKEIKDGINEVPAYKGSADNLRLHVTDTCNWSPHYDGDVDPPTINYGKPLLLVSLYLQQAYLIYLLDENSSIVPSKISSYIESTLAPILDVEKSRCARSSQGNAVPFSTNVPSILSGEMTPSQYQRYLAELQQLPNAKIIADFIAAETIFFVLTHEAGHHYARISGLATSKNTEEMADEFASIVFAKNKLSTTLAMGQLELFYFDASLLSGKNIRCRIATVVKNDSQINDTFSVRVSSGVVNRIRQLKSFYIKEYGNDCN